MEASPFNSIETGAGRIGLVGCGIGYAYCKEAEEIVGRKFPILKLGTLPLPREKVLAFADSVDTLIVFEETEPVVERLLKEILYDAGKNSAGAGAFGFLARRRGAVRSDRPASAGRPGPLLSTVRSSAPVALGQLRRCGRGRSASDAATEVCCMP